MKHLEERVDKWILDHNEHVSRPFSLFRDKAF